MHRIADDLADVPFLRHVVVILARAGVDELLFDVDSVGNVPVVPDLVEQWIQRL